MFKNFFKRRKTRTVAFGVLDLYNYNVPCYVAFYENDNGRRRYTVKGATTYLFEDTYEYFHCQIWLDTGLLPEWAKDPMAEKLMR